MKIDGGLSVVSGPMGSGKTLWEVRHGVNHMLGGGWWITNIQLYPDAFERIGCKIAPHSKTRQRRVHAMLTERYRYTESLEEALTHGVVRHKRRPGHAMARLGWDESLSDLNAREWAGGRGKTAADRADLFDRIPMLRKNGVAGFLLAQHPELIDKNGRRIANWYIMLQNQREISRFMGMRMRFLPPLFLAYWYQGNVAAAAGRAVPKPVKIERYTLSWHRNLYDTLGLYAASREDAETGRTIWLGA